jgi:hypothetical protein
LKGGDAMLQSDHMFRRIVADSYKARDRLPRAGVLGQKGFRFHNITSVGDGVLQKPWTIFRSNILFVGCEGHHFRDNRDVDIEWKNRTRVTDDQLYAHLQMVRVFLAMVMSRELSNEGYVLRREMPNVGIKSNNSVVKNKKKGH